jgi:O-antigen/teichoic acid export membrane protein
MKQSFTGLIRNKTLHNISMMFISQMGSKILIALSLVIVLRYITQEEFGMISLIQSLIVIGSGVFLQGLNFSFITKLAGSKSNTEEQKKFSTSNFYSTVLIGFILSICFYLIVMIKPEILKEYGTNNVYSLLIIAGILGTSLINFITAYYQGRELFRFSAIITFLQAFFIILSYLILIYFNLISLTAVLIVIAVTPCLFFLFTGFMNRKVLLSSNFNFNIVKKEIYGSRYYILYSSLLVIASQLDILMMSKFFSFKDVGEYSVASKLYSFFIIGLASIHTVLLPKFSSLKNLREMKALLLKSMRFTVPAALGLIIIVLLTSNWIIKIFAGSQYEEAQVPLIILSVSAGLSLILSPSANILFAISKVRILVISGIMLLVVAFLCHTFITSKYGADGAAISTLISYLTINGFLFLYVFKLH